MNILIVHPCKGFYGGAEEVVVQLNKYLIEHDHKVQISTKNPPKWNVTPSLCNEALSWQMFRRDVQRMSRWNDVVCCFNFPATLMTFPTKKPIVWYCNEPSELFTNWKRKPVEAFNRWWVKKSNMKVVVADQMNARRFFQLYGVEPTVIPYGIDYNFWSKGERVIRDTTDSRGSRSNPLRLLQVGTISPYKNQLQSLQTLKALTDAGLHATVTYVGMRVADLYYKQLLDFAHTHKLLRLIKFTGQVSSERVRALYYSHDVLLHPVQGQGGWLAPFEAMCTELPVVTGPEFSASELILRNGLGIITTRPDLVITEGMYTNVKTEHAKSWVKENLTWNKFGESMVDQFKEVVHARKGIYST